MALPLPFELAKQAEVCTSPRPRYKFPTIRGLGGFPTNRSTAATMDVPSNIFLIGSMGAGKSTIARRLAATLDKEFVDADRELEQRTGVEIPLIFELEGEDGFRKRERELLAELVVRKDIVLATGGGVVLSADNRANLAEHGFVIYLDAPVDLVVARVASTPPPRLTVASWCTSSTAAVATDPPCGGGQTSSLRLHLSGRSSLRCGVAARWRNSSGIRVRTCRRTRQPSPRLPIWT